MHPDFFVGKLFEERSNHPGKSHEGTLTSTDSGDIVNLFDQGDTSDVGYQFQAPNTLAREGAGALQHTNTETINVFTTSGVVDFIAFGSSPAINYNLQAQGSNDSFQFFDGFGVGADTNVIINAGGGADDIDIDETGGGDGGAGAAGFGAFIQINGEGGNDTFAIDDVGAGYSGLETVAVLKPAYLKIDIALVRDVHQKTVSQRVVKAILEMGDSLGAAVVAEGVETTPEADALRDIGVRWAQGYLFARPVDPYAEPSPPGDSGKREA